MSRRSKSRKPQGKSRKAQGESSPPPEAKIQPPAKPRPLPGGRTLLAIGAASFLLFMAVGLFRSFAAFRALPRVGVEYVSDLNALIQRRGEVATLPEIRTAAIIDFDNASAVAKLLASARQAGDHAAIVSALVAMVRLQPENAQIRNELVTELLQQNRLVEALAQGEFAVHLDPNSSLAHGNLGAALLGLNRKREAAAAYRKSLELDPTSAAARRALEFPLRGF